jgi:cellulose synthase/poly-beta-1,6-N-acetylglucosamine synthase-like glycosyltransferase
MNVISATIVVVFWVCLAALAFAYVGYPVLIWALARCFGRPGPDPAPTGTEVPSVSVLIAAYNEEAVIEERLQNALAMDYPPEKLEVVVASDGCTDATPEIVRRYADRGVRLLDYRQRRGKAAALNAAFPELKGEIVLLSDANTRIEPHALPMLIRWFQDPAVGVVCGRLVLTDPATGRNVDSLYWKYETFLKKCEGQLGGLLGANGGIYAIRRAVHAPIPPATIVDDFVIPLLAKLRSGCTIVYDREAVAHEETPPRLGSEFHRRSRIGAGGFQSIVLLWRLLDPRHGWTAFTFFSHKILRWLCPFFLLGMLVSNLCLLPDPLYRLLALSQFGFYGLCLVAPYLPARPRFLRPVRLTTMFAMMNLALLVGFWHWARGIQTGAWRRTARLAEAGTGLR